MRWLLQLASAHFLVIIFGNTGLGALVALGINLALPFFYQQPPRLLTGQPPSPALEVEDIEASTFFVADPLVMCADGKRYIYYEPSKTFKLHTNAEVSHGVVGKTAHACLQPHFTKMQRATSDVLVSCKSVQPLGEWCSAPYTSFATTTNGQVWAYEELAPCVLFTVFSMVFLGSLGFCVGLVFVGQRHAYRRRKLGLPPKINRHISS